MDAEDVVGMLNDYFSALTECIFRNDGSIDKFVGDAILAVFGSPDPDPQHRRKAVQAAVEMQRAMVEVNRRRSQRSETVCEIGIGVHSGEVLHGFIGSPERMEFTVIGDTVNKTARYCDGAQAGQVLISPEVHQHVWRMVEALPTSIPTKHEGDLPAYRVIGIKNGN
jgi:adenylate cyclase